MSVLSFSTELASVALLPLYINFRTSLSTSTKNLLGSPDFKDIFFWEFAQ